MISSETSAFLTEMYLIAQMNNDLDDDLEVSINWKLIEDRLESVMIKEGVPIPDDSIAMVEQKDD